MPLTIIAFWLSYIGGVCAALFNPVMGVALYVLVYHLNPETQWWGASVRAIGLRTSFVVAAAAGLGLLLRRPPVNFAARQFPPAFIASICFGFLAVATLFWGVGVTPRGEYLAEKFFKTLIILFIMLRCVRSPADYHLVLMAWLVGATYVGYQASGGAGVTSSGRLTAGLGGPDFADSSGLAVHMMSILPLVGALFFLARTWWGRVFALVAGALVVNTIIATRTRNVIVGFGLMAFTGVLSLPRGYRFKGVLAVIIGIFLSIQLTDPGWWARMESAFSYEHDASATTRLTLWKAAFEMASDYPLGIGIGNFHTKVMEYVPGLLEVRSAHNTVIACLAELGWLGLALFIFIVGLCLVRLRAIGRQARQLPEFTEMNVLRRRTRFHLGWHALALRTSLVGYLGCALFTTRLFTEDLWLLLGLAMCLENVARNLAAQSEMAGTASAHAAVASDAELSVAACGT
jgi:O-antigen ligase